MPVPVPHGYLLSGVCFRFVCGSWFRIMASVKKRLRIHWKPCSFFSSTERSSSRSSITGGGSVGSVPHFRYCHLAAVRRATDEKKKREGTTSIRPLLKRLLIVWGCSFGVRFSFFSHETEKKWNLRFLLAVILGVITLLD